MKGYSMRNILMLTFALAACNNDKWADQQPASTDAYGDTPCVIASATRTLDVVDVQLDAPIGASTLLVLAYVANVGTDAGLVDFDTSNVAILVDPELMSYPLRAVIVNDSGKTCSARITVNK